MAEGFYVTVGGVPPGPTTGYCVICSVSYPLAGGGHFLCIERARQALALLPEVLEDYKAALAALDTAQTQDNPAIAILVRSGHRIRKLLIGGERE